MRKRFLRAAVVFGLVAVTAVLIGDLFPDQVYASLGWGREWVRILTTKSNYGVLANKNDPKLRFDGGSLAAPFMLRKSLAPARPYQDAEGYKVFEAWISALRVARNPLIHSESAALLELDPVEHCFPADVRQSLGDALTDFAANNVHNWRFDVKEIGNTRLAGPTRERGPFRSEISFSAVGFNQRKTVAVIYATYWCGPRCASGTYYALNKRNGEWTNVRPIGRCGWNS